MDHDGVAYPCPELQLESAANLPVIELPAVRRTSDHRRRENLGHPELDHCFRLLDSAREADPDAIHWIESMRQVNAWSLLLVTRQGTSATFGLGDHARQIESLRAALDHAEEKGYSIDTINLIPKYNIPITLRDEARRRRARSPSPSRAAAEIREDRRARDLNTLLNRN